MKFVKDFVIPVVVLTVICVVVSAALVFTYQATKHDFPAIIELY